MSFQKEDKFLKQDLNRMFDNFKGELRDLVPLKELFLKNLMTLSILILKRQEKLLHIF